VVSLDGYALTIPQVTAVARYHAHAQLDDSPVVRTRMEKSRAVVDKKLEKGTSVYGISTGFGGSGQYLCNMRYPNELIPPVADTRTKNYEALGLSLLQHQHSGVLPTNAGSTPDESAPLPLLDPMNALSMPPSWVRAAILVRINSLVRGHSAVRWTVVEKMAQLLERNITPLVPLRGSISASGDLSPLSYVAGTLIGNPSIRAYTSHCPSSIISAPEALRKADIEPVSLLPKEHLGILNGTAFSAGLAALAVDDAVHLSLLGNVATAMGVEALAGTSGSFAPWIHEVARPHPGQIESAKLVLSLLNGSRLASGIHERELSVDEDVGKLRQDRYPLRTSPQFLGPQLEDILSAWESITIECNSSALPSRFRVISCSNLAFTATDNPLVDGESGEIHHAGNFQAMAVSNAMEKVRLSLHHVGKLLFAQSTELLNPTSNRGLPPSLAASNPSNDYHCKGLDIATAAYVSELGFLANPVTTHIQSAEMHNQAVNSLALISARMTVQALDVLSILTASYLYILCQAVDLRALQAEFAQIVDGILNEEIEKLISQSPAPESIPESAVKVLTFQLREAFHGSLEMTATMDAPLRMITAAKTSSTIFLDFLTNHPEISLPLQQISIFQNTLSTRTSRALEDLRLDYFKANRGPTPASNWMGRTKAVYEFIRVTLGVKMHGLENHERFEKGLGYYGNVGQDVSKIYEAIKDGRMQSIVAGLF
jgi:phenylalanine ammonia-lyase